MKQVVVVFEGADLNLYLVTRKAEPVTGSAMGGTVTLPHDFAGIGALVYALSFDWRIPYRHPALRFLQRLDIHRQSVRRIRR
jgi:hypothetical protein